MDPRAREPESGRKDTDAAPERKPTQRARRFHFPCPVCDGGNADATWKPDRNGDWRWFVGCFSASCRALRDPQSFTDEYLARLAVEVGAPSGATVLGDPLAYLGELIEQGGYSAALGGRVTPPAALPSIEQIEAWHHTLMHAREAGAWIYGQRGLTPETIERYRLGYAESGAPGAYREFAAFTLPVFEGGRLVNLRKRFWPKLPTNERGKPVKIVGLGGRGSQLYPVPPQGAFILGEGEFDVLLARQHGFPAVTSTAGVGHWKDDWNEYVIGRRVAVVYDSGSLAITRRRAQAFRAAGAKAWAVDLGLPEGDDITDWFQVHGRSADELRRLINNERRSR